MPRNSCKMLRDKQAIIRLAGAAAALGCAGIAAWYLTPAQSSCNSSIWSLLGGSATAPPAAEQQRSAEPAAVSAKAEEAEVAVAVDASSSSRQQPSNRDASPDGQQGDGHNTAAGAAHKDTGDIAVAEDAGVAAIVMGGEAVSNDSTLLQKQQQQEQQQQEQQEHCFQNQHAVCQEQQAQQQTLGLQHAEGSAAQQQATQEQQEGGAQQPQSQTELHELLPQQRQQQQELRTRQGQKQQQEAQQGQDHQKGQQQQQQQQQQHPLQMSKFEQQLAQWQQRQQHQADAGFATFTRSPRKQQHSDLPPLSPRWSESQLSPRQQQQQQQQPVLFPLSPGTSAGPFLERTLSGNSSASSTPRSASMRQRASINTTRKGPSLDLTMSSAAVARSLQMQYVDDNVIAAAGAHAQLPGNGATAAPAAAAAAAAALPAVRPLSASCALLCEQHCRKLQDIHGDLGETTALDIGCGTGGSCFELALSFSHVLGLDGDPLHVVAAKEMKERGQLEYYPLVDDSSSASTATAAAAASSPAAKAMRRLSEGGEELQHGVTRAAKVSDDIDRDKVRFWQYALPELPPKLQPVDAVLVEDVEGRLGPGLARVLEQVPSLLNPEGVCVVVLDDSSSSNDASGTAGVAADDDGEQSSGSGLVACMQRVRQLLEKQGLRFVKEQQLQYPLAGGSCGLARAGIWLQS